MADVFTPELTFGPAQSGIMTPTSPGVPYRTLRIEGNAYANYALALDFNTPDYWVSGTDYAALSSVPGYSFTRSGEQGAVDTAGTVAWFAANTPAINTAGYHAYGALTNLLIWSQEFDNAAWTNFDSTETANTTVAPDGTTTADTLTSTGTTAPQVESLAAVTNAQVYTQSIFIPAGGTAACVYLQFSGGGNVCIVGFNRTTGVPGAEVVLAGVSVGMVGYSVAVGTGWRFVVKWTAPGTASYNTGFGMCDAVTSRATAVIGTTLPMWQGQLIAGNFPNGGPLIVTAGATAAIGASVLSANYAALIDEDFMLFAAADLPPWVTGGYDALAYFTGAAGETIQILREPNGWASVEIVDNSVLIYSTDVVAISGAGRLVLGLRRKSGKYTTFVNWNGVESQGAESAALGLPTITTVGVGHAGGGNNVDGILDGVFHKTGTYTDAQALALLAGFV